MSRIARKFQHIFGNNAGPNERGVFGSLGAGSPAFTTDPEVIQSLSQYDDGWFSAVLGDNSPAIEDMNALHFLFGYQLAYLLQQGIPEWDVDTTYFIGQFVAWQGLIYVSITDNNLNHMVSDTANWYLYDSKIRTVTVPVSYNATDSLIRGNVTAGPFTITLPDLTTVPVGKKYIAKNAATNGNVLTLAAFGGQFMDSFATLDLQSSPTQDTVTVMNNGTNWDIL